MSQDSQTLNNRIRAEEAARVAIENSTGLYVNTANVPQTIGAYVAGEPATPPEGITLQEAINKILYPYIAPGLSISTTTGQSEWNQAAFNISVYWMITYNASVEGLNSLLVEYKKQGETSWTTLTTNTSLPSIQHSVTNNEGVEYIDYRITITDTYNETYTETTRRTMVAYTAPSIVWNNNSFDDVQVGADLTVQPVVTKTAANATLVSAVLEYSLDGAAYQTAATSTPLGDTIVFGSYTLNTPVDKTSVAFRVRATDSNGETSFVKSASLVDKFYLKFDDSSFLNDSNANSYIDSNIDGSISKQITLNATHISFIVPKDMSLTEARTGNNEVLTTDFNFGDITITVAGNQTKSYTLYTYNFAVAPNNLTLNLTIE